MISAASLVSARSLGLSVQDSSGGEELVLCPFHADNKASAWYSEKKGLFYCAVCGVGYNVYQLAKLIGIDREDVEEEKREELPNFSLMAEEERIDYGEAFYHPYLKKRGISQRIAMEYGIGWKTSTPQAAVLPITNAFANFIGVCYRFINVQEAGTRYMKLGEQTPLWPWHFTPTTSGEPIIVTEGAFSAMRIASYLDRCGLKGNIYSLLGAKANQAIVDAIKPMPVVVLYDNDFAGRRACKKLRELHPTVKAWTLNKVPDDMRDDEIRSLLIKLIKRVDK